MLTYFFKIRSAYVSFVIFLGLIAGGCSQPSGEQKPADVRNELVKLRVGYIPIAECAHLYVGITKKFFAQEGIELDLQPMKGGAIILPAVQQGDLDIGFTNVTSIILLDTKLPERDPKSLISILGASYERNGNSNHALLIKKGSSITVKDLGNPKTRIALNTTRNIEELMLRRFLTKNQVPESNLNIVPLGFPEMLSALERGDVDVISEVEPFIEPILRSGQVTLLARQYLDVSSNTVVATYAVTRLWLTENKNVAERLARAFVKADEFMRSNDAETRLIIGSFTRIRKDDLPIIGLPAFETKIKYEDINELINESKGYKFIEKDISPDNIIGDLNGK